MGWLEQRGMREETLIFFTSDNGMNMGHHGLCGKGNGSTPVNMYETSVRVPAIISLPGRIPANRRLDALYSHYDFLPTLLDFISIDAGPLDHLPGKSFAHVLRGGEEDHDAAICAFEEYGPVRMIRDRRYKLVRRYDGTGDELFDLQEDPEETLNLIDAPERQSTRQSLLQRMESWFDQYADPRLDGKTKPVTGRGQLDLAHLEQQGDTPFAQAWPDKWLADRKRLRKV